MSEDKKKELTEVAALRYSPDENQSPKIIALGKGSIGERILEAAKENNIPVFRDANLAHTLNKLSIGEEIPSELYGIVAEILVFVSNLDKGYGEQNARKK